METHIHVFILVCLVLFMLVCMSMWVYVNVHFSSVTICKVCPNSFLSFPFPCSLSLLILFLTPITMNKSKWKCMCILFALFIEFYVIYSFHITQKSLMVYISLFLKNNISNYLFCIDYQWLLPHLSHWF